MHIRILVLALMACIGIVGAGAQDNNDTQTYCTARFGDSFGAISTRTGVSVDSLRYYNPFISGDNIAEGTVVRLRQGAVRVHFATPLSMVDSIRFGLRPADAVVTTDRGTVQNVVVMLPFGVNNKDVNRQNFLATEFYRGLVLSAYDNRLMPDLPPVNIIAIDTEGRTDEAVNELKGMSAEGNTIVIPADDDALLKGVSQLAEDCDMLVVNIFNVKDAGYMTNPNVVQCNINQPLMYAHALDYLINEMSGYTPVILKSKEGASEKASFVEALKKAYAAANLEVIEIEYGKKLAESDLKKLAKNGRYVFVPVSGSADTFKSLAEVVGKRIEGSSDKENRLFGYPDWVTFTGEEALALHNMGAIIYSRFFVDSNDTFTREVNDAYTRWYGSPMRMAFPTQGMLGYDTGNMILRNLRKKWLDNEAGKFVGSAYNGRQSAFRFVHDNGSRGMINNALFIVEYLPGSEYYVRMY